MWEKSLDSDFLQTHENSNVRQPCYIHVHVGLII